MKLASAPTNKDELYLITAKVIWAWFHVGDLDWDEGKDDEHEDYLLVAHAIRQADTVHGVQSVPVVATDEMEVADHHGGYPSMLKASPFYTECD